MLVVYALTVSHVIRNRLFVADDALVFTSEAVWGMLAFATVPALAALGALYAAWQSRRPLDTVPWQFVDVKSIRRGR